MLRRTVIVPVLLLLLVLAGCAGSRTPSVAEDPGGDASSLVEGVPGDCTLLETADPDLAEEMLASIAADVAHGPLVVARFGGQTVVATTTYERPGVQGRAAAWTVVDGIVTAINEEADRISTVAVQRVDSAGEDALARAMAEAEDCSWVVADRSAEDPPDPDPSMRPDLLVAEPPVAGPGAEVALRFPQETSRGIAFQLDRRTADGWATTHWMSSDANGEQYQETVPAGTEGHAVIDVGVGGPGPDGVLLPDDIEPGEYRICTANAGDEFCAPLAITYDGLACDTELRESAVYDYEEDPEPSGATPLEAVEAQVREVFGGDVEFREAGPTEVQVARPDSAVVGTVSVMETTGGYVVSGYEGCG